MTNKELKHQLIERVIKLTDDNLLMDLIRLIDNDNIDNDIYTLSENHKLAIEKAIKQIENDDYLTNEQSNKEADEWLSK
jgi:hypothetical protein